MKKLFILVAASFVLANCAQQLTITSEPVSVKTTRNFVNTGIQSVDPTTFRTSLKAEGSSSYQEVDASCTISGPGYSAEFMTPAIVNLPTYGKTSPAITLSCARGNLKKAQVVPVVNFSAAERKNNATSTGVALGGIIGGLVAAGMSGNERAGDKFAYPSTTLQFN